MTYAIDNENTVMRLQERELEQSKIIYMCESLAPVTTRNELRDVVENSIKSILNFSEMMICITDEQEQNYNLFYHSNTVEYNKHVQDSYNKNADFFFSILHSPDPSILLQKKIGKGSEIPSFIRTSGQESKHTIITYALTFNKYNAVLFFCFDRKKNIERNCFNLIKKLSIQLKITLINISMRETNNPAAPAEINLRPENRNEMCSTMGIIGESDLIKKTRSLIITVSASDCNVLIQGESGTGKELAAKAIHYNSKRNEKPLIVVNCAAIPKNLIESELFGHEKGSFTGAASKKKGKFEQAHQGTIFLDEIGEMPLELQAKILRTLEQKEIQPIGCNLTKIVDIRIIAATNVDLQNEVLKGNFRADLFYRLNVFPIDIPPLRNHPEDIADLVKYFISRYCKKYEKPVSTTTLKVLNGLKSYQWPGNIRELEHAVEKAVLMSTGKIISEISVGSQNIITASIDKNCIKPWHEFEKEYILKVLKFCSGKVSGSNSASSFLEIPPTTLKSKMLKLGIKKRHYLLD
ncbi:formate hydrogenlyase transcriptional activator [Flavobacterium sp. 270]|uniref:sigma-54 interaction domain-containing protein n=1 Tax=Flavobacterium sp. 270 TaxID=2512114 RepID=UPI0010653ECF|nr:sigma-54 dependent transcriptional regulator [Flavobacterium sp. 270]TDW47781.1 formate hydrogenlyase transcriptional activator [Flavobacterium sp. 270]